MAVADPTPIRMAARVRLDRRANVLGVESGLEAHHAANFEITAKETADGFGFVFDNVEGAVFDAIAERNRSTHPDALPFRRGHLVADSLARDGGRPPQQVGDSHSTFCQQIFDVAQAEREPEIEPDRLVNDLRREPIPAPLLWPPCYLSLRR